MPGDTPVAGSGAYAWVSLVRYMYTRPPCTKPNPSAPNLWPINGLWSPGSLPTTSMVFDRGGGGAAPTTETSSSLKSMRCRLGSEDGVLVQGVSKNRRAVDTT